jgi:hypothetical protein
MDCASPETRSWPPYQPQQCYARQSGPGSGCGAGGDGGPCYCYETQPAWSAYREPAFGHGRLIIESPTSVSWRWLRCVFARVDLFDFLLRVCVGAALLLTVGATNATHGTHGKKHNTMKHNKTKQQRGRHGQGVGQRDVHARRGVRRQGHRVILKIGR